MCTFGSTGNKLLCLRHRLHRLHQLRHRSAGHRVFHRSRRHRHPQRCAPSCIPSRARHHILDRATQSRTHCLPARASAQLQSNPRDCCAMHTLPSNRQLAACAFPPCQSCLTAAGLLLRRSHRPLWPEADHLRRPLPGGPGQPHNPLRDRLPHVHPPHRPRRRHRR
jgi:hypothetical protein